MRSPRLTVSVDYTSSCLSYQDLCGGPSLTVDIDTSCCTCPSTDANTNCPTMPDDPNGCGDASTVGAQSPCTPMQLP